MDRYISKIQLEYFLTPYTETISKWVKKKKKTKFKGWHNNTPKGNIGNMLTDMDLCNIYLYVSPQAKDTQSKDTKSKGYKDTQSKGYKTAKINRYDLIKLKAFAQWREPSSNVKGLFLNGRILLQNMYMIRDKYLKITNISYSTTARKTKVWLKINRRSK